ncbi:hypothetical protein JHK85_025708 [Glycine max]|nr:hypothetical protein JHK85_025708 [Glycine max]KAG5012948.1 hypothetical protein JHK86_025209 [Glycine max]
MGLLTLSEGSALSDRDVLNEILPFFNSLHGWYSLDTVIVVESLALTLQASGNLKNSKELLERVAAIEKPITLQPGIEMVERLSTMGIASRQTLSSTEGKESEGKLVVKMKEELFLPKDDRDKISELPDNILLHMMDFMDTREAVQTCTFIGSD